MAGEGGPEGKEGLDDGDIFATQGNIAISQCAEEPAAPSAQRQKSAPSIG
jgi:hypothetical protein